MTTPLVRGIVRLQAVAAVSGLCSGANALTIAHDGASDAVIVVDDQASAPQQHAARELARFLREVTGVDLPVASHAPADGPRILVGPAAARSVDGAFNTDGLGAEGIVIRTVGSDLILAGGEPRGTLYAVYTFLEDHVGCRWWSSTVSSMPSERNLSVADLDIRLVPVLEFREPFWFDAFDGNWAARNKSNGHHESLDAQRGGQWAVDDADWSHTFYNLVPPEEHFADHPEWFSLIDGVRRHVVMAQYAGVEYPMPAQLCLTNEDMRRELVENLSKKLRGNPQLTYTSVSQMDEFPGYDGRCECDACKAVEVEEGSPAGLILRFVNAVAEDIEQEFPHVAIGTLAYHYTREPPRMVRPRHNVIVTLCSIECDCGVPLTHERNSDFREHILAWSKISSRLWIWDYVTNHANYIVPHPNLRTLAPNMRFYVAHGATGVFSQGAGPSPGAEMAELKAWVMAKLLWNPELDGQELVDEFVAGYYGPAAPHVSAYLNLIHDSLAATDEPLIWQADRIKELRFLRFEVLSEGWGYLEAAEDAVRDHPDMELRIKVAQLPVLHVFMLRWDEFRAEADAAGVPWPLPRDIEQVSDAFKDVARQAGITHLAEGLTDFDSALPGQ